MSRAAFGEPESTTKAKKSRTRKKIQDLPSSLMTVDGVPFDPLPDFSGGLDAPLPESDHESRQTCVTHLLKVLSNTTRIDPRHG